MVGNPADNRKGFSLPCQFRFVYYVAEVLFLSTRKLSVRDVTELRHSVADSGGERTFADTPRIKKKNPAL